jgi:hypothetical protein
MSPSPNHHDGRTGSDEGDAALEAARKAGAECLAAALRYEGLGLSVLPLCPPSHIGVGKEHIKKCDSPGKRPIPYWKKYQDECPTADDLRGWWKANPLCNVGVALGPVSNLIRVDVEGVAGEVALQAKSRGDLPSTWEFKSGRADGTGRGLLFAIPQGAQLRTTYESHGEKAELRFQAKGSQTVLPPSLHKDGGRYAWPPGHSPWDIGVALAPDWLVTELAAEKQRKASGAVGERIAEGQRNTKLTSLAGTLRRRGLDEDEIRGCLLFVNLRRCDPPLPDEDVAVIAHSVARYKPEANLFLHVEEADDTRLARGIIRQHWEDALAPAFRRGDAIYSAVLAREIKRGELCFGASSDLVALLANATDANTDGKVVESKLPTVFRRWAPTAWQDLMARLPDEEGADDPAEAAAVEFRSRVTAGLLRMVSLGRTIKDDPSGPHTRTEHRSLIGWAALFAKNDTRWQGLRSYLIWFRRANDRLTVAVRSELFSQIPGLGGIDQAAFAKLAQTYGVGRPLRAGGQWAVELAPAFLDAITATPDGAVEVDDAGGIPNSASARDTVNGDNLEANSDAT